MSKTTSYEKINYILRPAKNIERKLLLELFSRLDLFAPMQEYQYVGFGSVYFADFSLMHKTLGIEKMISIEGNEGDAERVRYNMPFGMIDLEIGRSTLVLPKIDWQPRSILWLDYDYQIQKSVFDDIALFCQYCCSGSLLLVTLDAEEKRLAEPLGIEVNEDYPEDRLSQLKALTRNTYIPADLNIRELRGSGLGKVYTRMMRSCIDKEIKDRNQDDLENRKIVVRQVVNIHYSDGARMMTSGWIFLSHEDAKTWDKEKPDNLMVYNESDNPLKIKVPHLTYKEVRGLNEVLPSNFTDRKAPPVSNELRELYSKYYRYFPTFVESELSG